MEDAEKKDEEDEVLHDSWVSTLMMALLRRKHNLLTVSTFVDVMINLKIYMKSTIWEYYTIS